MTRTKQDNQTISKKKYQHNNEDFMIDGKWMPGKKHNQTCSFIDKEKCCKKKQNLHFEFHNARLNTINAVQKLRKILKIKKLLLIGDSLMVEFFYGLAELLRVKIEMSSCGGRCTIHPGKNATITYLKACVISLRGQKKFFSVPK